MSAEAIRKEKLRWETKFRGEDPRCYGSPPSVGSGERLPAFSSEDEVVNDLFPYVKVYKNGWVERVVYSGGSTATDWDSSTGVSSKNVKISENVAARIYIPGRWLTSTSTTAAERIPVLVYYHGGGFCLDSAFSFSTHSFMNLLAQKAHMVIVSVDYRRAPEHPVPAAFEDAWEALQWVASQVLEQKPAGTLDATRRFAHGLAPWMIAAPASQRGGCAGPTEPWLVKYGNFGRIFVGGDEAGGTLAHYVSLQAGSNLGKPEIPLAGAVKVFGTILCFPYFIGKSTKRKSIERRLWDYVSQGARIDDPMINPFDAHNYNVKDFQFQRMFVCYEKNEKVGADFVKEMNGVDSWKIPELTAVEVKERKDEAEEVLSRIVDFVQYSYKIHE